MSRPRKPTKNKPRSTKLEPYYDNQNQFLVYEVDRKNQKTIYHVRGSQAKQIPQIELDGFLGIPVGLYLGKNGYGFGKKGIFLLSMLRENINSNKALQLIIKRNAPKSTWKESAKQAVVTLPFTEAKKLLKTLSITNEKHNDELREIVGSFLTSAFPKRIALSHAEFDKYQPGELAQILQRPNVKNALNQEDFEAVFKFLPELLTADLKGKKGVLKEYRIRVLKEARKVTDRIYISDVINEFESHLAKKDLAEEKWQVFLGEKVFPYLTTYVTKIDKEIIDVEGKKPDFVLVDIYNFVDVFEIKKHSTKILVSDESRENYYWSSEISPAISQCENYTDELVLNSKEYAEKIRRRYKIPIRVIRPKGFIIAGTRKQLDTEKKQEDYRRLSRSLKNTEFILYDELLDNLKNIHKKLAT
jgi:hypothetical protein